VTEHMFAEQAQEDTETMRSLGRFVGLFAAFTLLLALGVAFFAP
jgi:hypothetical protein